MERFESDQIHLKFTQINQSTRFRRNQTFSESYREIRILVDGSFLCLAFEILFEYYFLR